MLHPGVGVTITIDTDIPAHVYAEGLRHLTTLSPHSTGNTAFFSPTSGSSSSTIGEGAASSQKDSLLVRGQRAESSSALAVSPSEMNLMQRLKTQTIHTEHKLRSQRYITGVL